MPSELALILGPSPAPGSVRIWYELPREQWVSVCVFDAEGRRVVTLVSNVETPGRHEVEWDGTIHGERRAGTYFCRITADNRSRESVVLLLAEAEAVPLS